MESIWDSVVGVEKAKTMYKLHIKRLDDTGLSWKLCFDKREDAEKELEKQLSFNKAMWIEDPS
jgi:hypothetical protein